MQIMSVGLGIDYGVRRVGFAVAHGTLAEPLEIFTRPTPTPANDADVVGHVQDLIKRYQVAYLVVGVSEGVMAERERAFIARLHEVVGLPVFQSDETLSTHDAMQHMHDAGKKLDKSSRDAHAAAVVLQRWLDEQQGAQACCGGCGDGECCGACTDTSCAECECGKGCGADVC